MLYCPNFFWNVLQVWITGKDVYLQMTWSWPDKTWNILCSYCLQWNTSQSKFRNHYFLFLFAFSILSQLFLIWGCRSWLTHTPRALLNDRKLTPAAPHVLLSFLVMMSPAADVSSIDWTDYTYYSELGIAEGVPLAFSDAARVPEGELCGQKKIYCQLFRDLHRGKNGVYFEIHFKK